MSLAQLYLPYRGRLLFFIISHLFKITTFSAMTIIRFFSSVSPKVTRKCDFQWNIRVNTPPREEFIKILSYLTITPQEITNISSL